MANSLVKLNYKYIKKEAAMKDNSITTEKEMNVAHFKVRIVCSKFRHGCYIERIMRLVVFYH